MIFENIYRTEPIALNREGKLVYTINEFCGAKQILDLYISEIVNKNLLDRLKEASQNIIPSSKRVTTLFVFNEKDFDSFCKLASKNIYNDKNIKEVHILCNVLYTTHKGFSERNIPQFVQNTLTSENLYDKSELYYLRVLSDNYINKKLTRVEDIILYLPKNKLGEKY